MRKALLRTSILILLDAISKKIAFVLLQPSLNTGAAFGISIPNEIVIGFTLPLLLGFFWFIKKYYKENTISLWILSLIMAGGIGNFLDRAFLGGVVDFIDLGFWPAFNFADSYLTIGAFLLLFFHGKLQKDHESPTQVS